MIRILFFTLILFSQPLLASDCGNYLASSYSAAITELAKGFVILEERKVNGENVTLIRLKEKKMESKRLEIISHIGESEFAVAFEKALAEQSDLFLQAHLKNKVRRQESLVDEGKKFGVWKPKFAIGAKTPDDIINPKLSPDGRFVVYQDNKYHVFLQNLDSGLITPLFAKKTTYLDGHFSKDSRTFQAVLGDKRVRTWSLETGEALQDVVLENSEKLKISAAQLSPDGLFILGYDEEKTAHVWNTVTGQQVVETPTTYSGFTNFHFTPDSKFFVTTKNRTVTIWSINTGKSVATLTLESNIWPAGFTPDGQLITQNAYGSSGSYAIHLWYWQDYTKNNFFKFWRKRPLILTGRVQAHHFEGFTPDGHYLLMRGDENEINLVSSKTGKIEKTLANVRSLGFKGSTFFSSSGEYLLVTTRLGYQLWDYRNETQLDNIEITNAFSGQISNDGKRMLLDRSGDSDELPKTSVYEQSADNAVDVD